MKDDNQKNETFNICNDIIYILEVYKFYSLMIDVYCFDSKNLNYLLKEIDDIEIVLKDFFIKIRGEIKFKCLKNRAGY